MAANFFPTKTENDIDVYNLAYYIRFVKREGAGMPQEWFRIQAQINAAHWLAIALLVRQVFLR
jgi:hypothetical protein